jgi:hypothetical protein
MTSFPRKFARISNLFIFIVHTSRAHDDLRSQID